MTASIHSQLVQEQAQAERTAGKLLTKVCNEQNLAERARLLQLAFWNAGQAVAFEAVAELHVEEVSGKPRGSRR